MGASIGFSLTLIYLSLLVVFAILTINVALITITEFVNYIVKKFKK